MFCSNCGKPLPDGAKFCMNCGAKVSAPSVDMTEVRPQAPAPKAAPEYSADWGTSEPVAKPKKATERKVSFDWSSVIDESHKKPRVEVRSPWDSTGLDEDPEVYRRPARQESLEEEIFAEAKASKKTEDRGRTLTFIDILKQEREEKERKAYEAARRIEDDVRDYDYDTPLPVNTILPEDERVVTQGYTDLQQDIIAEMEKGNASAKGFDKQLESAKERRLGSTPIFTPEPPRSFVDDYFQEPRRVAPKAEVPATPEDELEEILAAGEPVLDEPVAEEPVFEAPVIEEPAVEEVQPEVEAEDLFDDVEPEDSYDEYMDYVPRGRAARHQYEEEFDYDDEDDEIEEVEVEEPAKAESVSAVDDEIAALQAKLEMLLGQKNGTIPVEEPVAEEEPAEEIGEYLDEEDIFNVELSNDEPAVEEIEEDIVEAVEEPEVEEPVVEEPETQTFEDEATMSVEQLLNDLLPEEARADAPVAAAAEPTGEDSVIEDDELDLDAALNELAGTMEPVIEEPAPAEPVIEDPVAADLAAEIADLDAELASLGFEAAEPETPAEPEYNEADMLFTAETTDTSSDTVAISTEDLAAQEAMSIEELEKDLFGTVAEDPESEATKKIEKFYTLYRKNDEFQKLLDAEYDKLQGSKYDGPAPENELLASEPDVDALTQLIEEVEQPAPEKKVEVPAVAPAAPVVEPAPEKAKKESKADKKAAKKAAKAAKKAAVEMEEDEDEGKGGGILTILAIIVALLLVVLLVIILVLNFAPDSGIAQTLNEVIGNFTSLIASKDNTELLL